MLQALGIVAAFVVLTAMAARQVLAHFGTHLGGEGTDALLLTWIMTWDVHALATWPLQLFDANLSYPIERSLAFSDHLLGVVPFFAPVYLATGNAAAGYNAVLAVSFLLSALAATLLAWSWTRRWWPAIVAGTLFAFAPLRLSQLGHLQLLTFFWAPVALYFLDRFLRRRRWRDAVGLTLFYCLQQLSSFYLGMILGVGVVVYVAYWLLTVDGACDRVLAVRGLAIVVATGAILLPLMLPYVGVFRSWEASWAPGGMAGFSADVQSYLSAPALMNDVYVRIFRPVTPAGAHERLLFPGLLLPALVLVGAFVRPRSMAEPEVRRARRLFGCIALVAFVLSLGPYLVIWGRNTRVSLPYLGLYHVVPGWAAMRVPARFAFLLTLALVPLAAMGAQALIERAGALRPTPGWRRLAAPTVGIALVGLFLVELGGKAIPVQPVPTGSAIPEVYRWLARERPGPIVEIPLGEPRDEQRYLYLSTVHWLPTVNGRSGFAPSSHDAAKAILAELPTGHARQYAAALGLRAIVVHGDALPEDDRIRWALAEDAGHVRRLATLGADAVYAVDPTPLATVIRGRVAMADVVPPGTDVRVGLRLDNDDKRPWVHRPPHRIGKAVVRWNSGFASRPSLTTETSVVLPLVVGAGESVPLPLPVTTPAEPGRYSVEVGVPALGVVTAAQTVDVREGPRPLDSAGTEGDVAARYLVDEGRRPAVDAGDSLALRVVAVNSGGAVWLARPRAKKGDVGLEWVWLDADARPVPESGGRTPVRYDVHPGQRYEFDLWPAAPVRPGAYVLRITLVRGGMGPFAGDPLNVAVDVRPVATAGARP